MTQDRKISVKNTADEAVSAVNTTAAVKPPVSPNAPKVFARLPPIAGVRLASGAAGVHYKGRTDVMMAVFAPGTQVAGVFTKSKAPSAPVDWCKTSLAGGVARTLVVNSGNANAFTGKAGFEGARDVARSAAATVGCKASEVFMASTGVIGEPLPAERIIAILDTLAAEAAPDSWRAAAEAIMTTDTFPKMATATAQIGDKTVTINGMAKGAGMIAPDMATMLSFVVTDATLPATVLQELLSEGVKDTFNSITVDSDTSTSDTLLLFATGKGAAHAPVARASDKKLADFREKLHGVLLDLALQVVKDGEGAGKFIRIDVTGAESDDAAKKIAFSIANSPLVKTAVAGNDANWGRVVMAVGKSGEMADRDKLSIRFGKIWVAKHGARAKNYDEAAATRAVSGLEVEIGADIGLGEGKATVWTCDFTHAYIDINGSYRS
ncbi:MAG: bifunctional glutamate N-acetyltransferase/amino-acid acetyltransferase ArgJ [Rhizomicrobium sp.]